MDQVLIEKLSGLNDIKDIVNSDSKAKGWHTSEPKIGDFCANLHGEVSELWESYRAHKLHEPCDKAEKMQNLLGEKLTCAEEEIADIIIRSLDTAYVLNIDVERAIRLKMEFNRHRSIRHGGKIA